MEGHEERGDGDLVPAESPGTERAGGVQTVEYPSRVHGGLPPAPPLVSSAVFLASAWCLACLGVVAVQTASVTSRQEGFEPIYLSRHLVNLTIACGFTLWAATRATGFWRRAVWPAALLTLIALAAVRVPSLGMSAGGATRWVRLPGFTMQPSEWAKIALPLLAAWWLMECGSRRAAAAAITIGGACLALVLTQPDLGTTLLLGASVVTALWIGGLRIRVFAVGAALLIPVIAAVSLRGYQMRRIEGLLATWQDWREAPYQLKQSLIALAEGGWWGVGLGQGWQKLSFLPESHTDFVLAVVGEEMGWMGLAVVAALWMALMFSGLQLAARAGRFEGTVAGTLVLMLSLQAALNAAVVTAVVPPTGIPHPLLSYGGNSLLVTGLALGMTLSLTRREYGAVAETSVADDAPLRSAA